MLQLRTINKVFREDGLPVELVRGEGYFYYQYEATAEDGRLIYDSEMVCVYRLNHLTYDHWVDGGRRFALEVEHRFGVYRKDAA